ncbi:MAG TPA: DnaJ domain-containing protein [Roseiflexaceae bacterium]|nr:DnaJ domain-containing protein [Roseiflexaceae bacterium]
MAVADFYEILQVHPRADTAAIEAAYRRLADLYDPDRLAGAAEELVLIAREKRAAIDQAYAVLSDPLERAAYDRQRIESTLAATSTATTSDARLNDTDPTEALSAATPADPAGEQITTRATTTPDADAAVEPIYDYRPLPPAQSTERARGFNTQPTLQPSAAYQRATVSLVAIIVAVGVLLPALAFGSLLTSIGSLQPPAATATPSPLDQFEVLLAQARLAVEQQPDNAQAWVDYANLLYDSAQIVREQAPESVLYQQRLPRWLEAIAAYRRALELVPDDARIRGEIGASACFYGIGVGDLRYIEEGLNELQQATAAIPDDVRMLLNIGHCRVNVQPPQIDAAIRDWQQVITIAPGSPFAIEAQRLIDEYRAR